MSQLAGTPVLILKEGSKREKGKEAQHANIMAAQLVAEAVKSARGPKGMDKMLVDSFGDVTIKATVAQSWMKWISSTPQRR